MANKGKQYGAGADGVERFGDNGYTVVLVDEPVPGVRRITLNRPEKRNALNHALRGEVLHALQQGDFDESVKVQIIRGAGSCFSAGYDLGGGNEGMGYPFYPAGGDGQVGDQLSPPHPARFDLAGGGLVGCPGGEQAMGGIHRLR